jgi:hypothetical protein
MTSMVSNQRGSRRHPAPITANEKGPGVQQTPPPGPFKSGALRAFWASAVRLRSIAVADRLCPVLPGGADYLDDVARALGPVNPGQVLPIDSMIGYRGGAEPVEKPI